MIGTDEAYINGNHYMEEGQRGKDDSHGTNRKGSI